MSPPSIAPVPDRLMDVLEFVRVSPSMAPVFERMALNSMHPWEQEQSVREIVARSETARFLVADGWDYLRTYAVRDLGAWQAYVTARSRYPAAFPFTRLFEQRKTMILRELESLRVR